MINAVTRPVRMPSPVKPPPRLTRLIRIKKRNIKYYRIVISLAFVINFITIIYLNIKET